MMLKFLSRNKFFILGCAFFVLNGIALYQYNKEEYAPIKVQQFKAETELERGGLVWLFNQAVNDEDGQQVAADSLINLSPDIEGSFSWRNEQCLVFEPEDPWQPCHAYVAELKCTVEPFDTKGYSGDVSWHLDTDALKVLDCKQISNNSREGLCVQLRFNAPVDVRDLSHSLKVVDSEGETQRYRVLRQLVGKEVQLRIAAESTGMFKLKISKGLKSTVGPVGLEKDAEFEVQAVRKQMIRSTQATTTSNGGYIQFHTTQPLDLDHVMASITVEPAVADLSIQAYYRGRYRLAGSFKPLSSYVVTFRKGLPAKDDAPALQETKTSRVYFKERPPKIEFDAEGQILSASGGGQLKINYVSIGNIHLSARRIYSNNLVFVARNSSGFRNGGSHIVDQLSMELASTNLAVKSVGEQQTLSVDVKELMGGDLRGAFLVEARGDKSWYHHDEQLLIYTDLGIAARHIGNEMLIWVNRLGSALPVDGAEVKVFSRENQLIGAATSDADGLVHLEKLAKNKGPAYLVTVQYGDDLSMLLLNGRTVCSTYAEGGRPWQQDDEAFVFADRGVYRPGETVHVAALLRTPAGIAPIFVYPLDLGLWAPDGKRIGVWSGMLDEHGAVDFDVELSDAAALGTYSLRLSIPGGEGELGSCSIQVEEFAPPRVEVQVEPGSEPDGKKTTWKVGANYFFGAPASALALRYEQRFAARKFAPEGFEGWSFADATVAIDAKVQRGRSTLNDAGKAAIIVDIPKLERVPAALELQFTASVTQPGGRTISRSSSLLYDACPAYVGLRLPSSQMNVDKEKDVDLVMLSPAGAPVSGERTVSVELTRTGWECVLRKNNDGSHSWKYEERPRVLWTRDVLLKDGRGSVAVEPTQYGDHILRVSDPEGGAVASDEFYACWFGDHDSGVRTLPGRIELLADKKSYLAGEEAVLQLRAPFAGRLLLTLSNDSIVEQRIVELKEKAGELRISLSADMGIGLHAVATMLRPVQPAEVWSPHFAAGAIFIPIDQPEHKLTVELKVPEQQLPEATLPMVIKTTNAAGELCPAELFVFAVDDGVCGLTDYSVPKPIPFFFGPRSLAERVYELYRLVIPEKPEAELVDPSSLPGGGDLSAKRANYSKPTSKRFKISAYWHRVSSTGEVTVDVPLDDFQGRLRCMAVAVSPSACGSAEGFCTVKSPLTVEVSLPRFVSPGDRFLATFELFNNTEQAVTLDAALELTGARADSAANRQITVPANARVEERWTLTALAETKTVDIALNASSDTLTGRTQTVLPLRAYGPFVTHNDMQVIDAGDTQRVTLSDSLVDPVWSLKATACPIINLLPLENYLQHYRYGCTEQTVSSRFPWVDFTEGGSLTEDEAREWVQHGLYRIYTMQNWDGGFGWWRSDRGSDVALSAYVTRFLLAAKAADYPVSDESIAAALKFLSGKLSGSADVSNAGICRVLVQAGLSDKGWLNRLWDEREELSANDATQLAWALYHAGRRRDARELLDQCLAKGPKYNYSVWGSGVALQSEQLALLLKLNAQDKLVEQMHKRLIKSQDHGRWYGTRQNAAILMALNALYKNRSADDENIRGVLQGSDSILFDKEQPLEITGQKGTAPTVSNLGDAPIYLFWTCAGHSTDPLPAASSWMSVKRKVMNSDGSKVEGNRMVAGELYVVEWTVSVSESVDHLAVSDLLPAGLEVESTQLKGSQKLKGMIKGPRLPLRHVEERDDRIVAFSSAFSGKVRYAVAVRAVTPGTYSWPGLAAEAMYDPTVFARSESSEWVVVP